MDAPARPRSPQPPKKGTGPALLREVITTALQQKIQGDLYNYQFIIHQIRSADAASWRKWLLALTSCVASLTKENHELVGAALSYEWTTPETDEVFIAFLIHLSSSSSFYVHRTLQKLISHLAPVKRAVDPVFDATRTELVVANVHRSFQHILHLIPTSSTAMLELLVSSFPHKRRDLLTIRIYLKAILDICTYVPPFRDRLFALAIEKAVQIDAEIKVEEATDADDEQFPTDEELQRQKEVPEMAAKLDDMMELLFQYVQANEANADFFNLLLRVFEAIILPTHKSKYTQFLLFFMCSKNGQYLDAFVSSLVAKLFDARLDTLTRQTCAAYLASFLARAAYVPMQAVRHVLTILARWLHEYVASHGVQLPDAEAHGVFYSVCQSVLYIFCFHARSILAQDDGREWFAALNLVPIFMANLNPLKICFQVAVLEFVKITETKELLQLSPLIERNRRLVLPKTAAGNVNILEAFFPFDPYLLRVSSAHLTGLYLEWEHGPGDEDEDGSQGATDRSSVSQGTTPAQTPQWQTLGGSLPDEHPFSLGRAISMDTHGSTPVAHSPAIPISETFSSSPGFARAESYSMR